MTEDILERAKKADIDLMAITDWGQLRDLFGELIAEVEAKNDKIAQDAITIQMHHGNVLTLQKEVERLRSENKIISDRAAHHEKQDAAEIELLAARIKELEAVISEAFQELVTAGPDIGDIAAMSISLAVRKLASQNKRLEAAFLKSETERKFYTTINGMNSEFDWNGYPECPQNGIHKEWFRQQAREALERIRNGE